MKFVDIADIKVRAGNGGRGCVSFRREKYVPRGGPNGGDGGRGGDVVFLATHNLSTLLDFKYLDHYEGERGGHGLGSDCHGKDGETLKIKVPVGTVITDRETGETMADLVEDGQTVVVARGGRGGKGNTHFKSSTHQAPRFAQPGEEGEQKLLRLELKLLADVGLVGLPNAGKSTLLSVVSAARPKIADYPFTTLVPNLGVVRVAGIRDFVMADIPGLIEGAHQGAGLGIQFLRHVERTRLILHLVDVSYYLETDPVQEFQVVRKELAAFHESLAEKRTLVAATKADMQGDGDRLARLRHFCEQEGFRLFPVSSITREGLEPLMKSLAAELEQL